MARYDKEAEAALNVFAKALTQREWKYERDADCIVTGVVGEDLPMRILIRADAETGMLQLFSGMPVTISQDKIPEMAMIVNEFNDGRMLSNFDFDIMDGEVIYRVSTCAAGCSLNAEACHMLLDYTIKNIDAYNDKFVLFNKGILSLEDMLESMNA